MVEKYIYLHYATFKLFATVLVLLLSGYGSRFSRLLGVGHFFLLIASNICDTLILIVFY